jgi:hypothetical protein
MIARVNYNNFKYEENIHTSNRMICDSDLDKSEINNKNKYDTNIIKIYNLRKNTNQNENNNNLDNNIVINNVNNNNSNNDSDNENNNGDNDGNNNEENENKKRQYFKFIEKLKNNNDFIFIKDYLEQKTDENNKRYMNWLKNLYIKLKCNNNKNNINKIILKYKTEISYDPKRFKEIINNFFECSNPECKSITYLTNQLKTNFKNLPDLYLEEYIYGRVSITNYEKIRCPLCLKYKCKYCKRLSTLKSSLCCPFQAFKACYETNVYGYGDYIFWCLGLYTPIVRVCFFGFMTNFPFYRALTRTHQLLQSKEKILQKINSGMTASKACESYQIMLKDKHHFYYNIVHLAGSLIWTVPFVILFEVILILFMLISFCINKPFFKKFLNCYYLFCLTPGLRNRAGHIVEK